MSIPNQVPVIRILKIATCPSLSGKSTLTYHIACTADDDILFRVFENSAAGLFSREWISLKAIGNAFSKVQAGKTITSFELFPLFKGRSQNTPSFMFAALYAEGLVERSGEDQRRYEYANSEPFMQEVAELMASNVDLVSPDLPSKPGAKAIASKKPQPKSSSGNSGGKGKPGKMAKSTNT